MTPNESAFERNNKKTSLLAKSMLAERKHKVASIMAMLMFIMSAISSAQVMFLDLGVEDQDSSSSDRFQHTRACRRASNVLRWTSRLRRRRCRRQPR